MTFIKTHSVESRCHCRTRKYTVSRHVPASFSLEVLQAGAVKGLRTMLTYFSSPLGQMGSLQSDKQYGNFIPWNIRWCREGCWNLCMTNDVQSTESKHRKVQTNVFFYFNTDTNKRSFEPFCVWIFLFFLFFFFNASSQSVAWQGLAVRFLNEPKLQSL